jgi:hypothetical protein
MNRERMEEGKRPSKASRTVVTTAGVTEVCAAQTDSAGRMLVRPFVAPQREEQGHGHHH